MSAKPLIRLMPEDQLGLLIGAFLDDCMLANLSQRSIDFYRGNLERFHWWCEQSGGPLDPAQHTPVLLRQFLRYLQEDVRWDGKHTSSVRKMTPTTLDAYYRTLRRFYNWCLKQEFIDRSPLEKVQAPKAPAEQPDPFSPDEVRALFAAIEERSGRFHYRDRAILAVLLDVGLRVSELCNLSVDDVFADGKLIVRHGKGDKQRSVVLGAKARQIVRQYLVRDRQYLNPMERVKDKRPSPLEGPFFLALHDKPMTPNGVHQMLKKLGKLAGVKPANPHRFRHTFGVNAVRAGMDLLHLQMALGHTSLEMTRRYVKLANTDMEAAARKHSPLDYLSQS